MSKTYEIVENGRAIKCLVCDMTSYHPKDVENKYCGKCHEFHNILEMIAKTKEGD